MEKGKKIPPQEASRTNPVAKPEDTKGGINNKVSSGLIGKKLAEQAEENEEMPMHHLIADKDYPSGIREWMITSPSDLKYPTLVVAAAMLSVYLTRVRIQYVYDNQGEKSAIVLQVRPRTRPNTIQTAPVASSPTSPSIGSAIATDSNLSL